MAHGLVGLFSWLPGIYPRQQQQQLGHQKLVWLLHWWCLIYWGLSLWKKCSRGALRFRESGLKVLEKVLNIYWPCVYMYRENLPLKTLKNIWLINKLLKTICQPPCWLFHLSTRTSDLYIYENGCPINFKRRAHQFLFCEYTKFSLSKWPLESWLVRRNIQICFFSQFCAMHRRIG